MSTFPIPLLVVCLVHGCPYLRDPGNGRVTYEGTTASFVCDSGYKLVGSSSVNCNNCGKWQGEAPVCVAGNNLSKHSMNSMAKRLGVSTDTL